MGRFLFARTHWAGGAGGIRYVSPPIPAGRLVASSAAVPCPRQRALASGATNSPAHRLRFISIPRALSRRAEDGGADLDWRFHLPSVPSKTNRRQASAARLRQLGLRDDGVR